MKLSNSQELPVSQQQAWAALNDTAILQSCIPGCEALVDLGENRYEVVVVAAVGPVKARFKGRLELADLQAPRSYELRFEGQGGPAGHGKGSARVELAPLDAHRSLLHYTASATVGGKLAQVGQRLIDMAAQRMAADFFASFDSRLRASFPVAVPEPLPPLPPVAQRARPGLWQRLRTWFARAWPSLGAQQE